MKIITGHANPPLAESVAAFLELPLTRAELRRFPDSESFVEIMENVRGEDVFAVQSTSAPVNDNLMELLIIIDALKRGSAQRITAVLPYFGYARQDRKSGPRSPISAKLVANLITKAGANRVLTLDLHAGQIQGFFDIPTDNLYAQPVFIEAIRKHYGQGPVTIIAPDTGGVARARAIARRIDANLAVIDKRRERAGVAEVMNIIGDVSDQQCILVDDIVDTAGTLCKAACALMDHGSKGVSAFVTHGVFSGDAIERIIDSPIQELVVTDSILATSAVREASKIRQLAIGPLLGEAIGRIAKSHSVSSLFK